MVATPQDLFYRHVKSSKNYLQRFDTGEVLSLPAAEGVLTPGIKEKTQMATNGIGNESPVAKYIDSEEPKYQMIFKAGALQPEIMELLLGRRFASSSQATTITDQLTVPVSGTIAAVITGKAGFGMVVDTAVASIKGPTGLSVQLTRVPFANVATVGAALSSFAQGANGAFTFSDDLIGQIVTYTADVSAAVVTALTDNPIGLYRLRGRLYNSADNTIWTLSAEEASPDLDGSKIDPKSENVTVDFTLFTPAGRCRAYDLALTNLAAAC